MKQLTVQGIVLVLMLAALPLASIGSSADTQWLAVAALVVFGIAALVPPVRRFAGGSDDDEEDS